MREIQMLKICAIVAAAGKGSRMNLKKSKQYIEIEDKPILYYTLKTLSECDMVDEIILTASHDELKYCKKEVVQKYGFMKVKSVVEGGSDRQSSVYNALKSVSSCDIILIHDGVRPFIDKRIISEGIKYAELYGASACGVSPKDTIKVRGNDGFSIQTPDRSTLFCVQTPQIFKFDIILDCHEKAVIDKLKFTDDTAIVEQYGHKVYLYEGSYDNIKITTREDLITARYLVEKYDI